MVYTVNILGDWKDYISLIFQAFGAVSFFWIIFNEYKSSLKIDLNIIENKAVMTLLNNSFFKKKIKSAFILITPFEKDNNLIQIFNKITKEQYECTNDFYSNEKTIKTKEACVIQLEYFTGENIQVGDELLKYEYPLSELKLDKGLYSVRFFLYSDKKLHRCVHGIYCENKIEDQIR